MDLKHLVERLKHAFNMEQRARKQGGWGVTKPFKSIDDSLYGAAITKLEEQQEQIRRLTVLIEERDKTLDEYDARNNPAVAAIQYALNDDDCKTFLRLWNEGEFDALREEWDNVPDEVFDGADPLHGL